MSYLQRLINAGIYDETEAYIYAMVGLLLWAGTLVSYLWLYMTFSDDNLTVASNFVLAIISIHGTVLLLTLADAYGPSGKSIVLQTIIIALGSFNTFALGGIVGSTLVGPSLEDGFFPAILSLSAACVANSQMLASLFALFHTGVDNSTPPPKRPVYPPRYQPQAGFMYQGGKSVYSF